MANVSDTQDPATGGSRQGAAPAGRPGSRFWVGYAAAWLLLGLALALADAQDPRLVPGRRPWEPFFLEMGSVAVVGALAVAVYLWVRFLERTGWGAGGLALAHAAGACAFVALHVGITYASRFGFYAAIGLEYRARAWGAVLAFEAPKDFVTYAVVAGLAIAWRLHEREQAHRIAAERARSELAELRLARLGDQLHPHFLFNCLHSIASLVEENPKAAIAMIARVGDFLRASLRHDGPASTLGREIELVGHYLAIQALRFEGAVDWRADVATELAARTVPHLILQPLAENAIRHTMVRPDRPLVLRLAAVQEAGRLVVSVTNGRGGERPRSDGAGRGLGLVRQRLALLYGEAARLEIDESDPAWFRVRVVLPDRQAGP